VNLSRSPSSSSTLASSAAARPISLRSPTASPTSCTVGSASSATARATSAAAGLRLSRRSRTSVSRSAGSGSCWSAAMRPPRRRSARASSMAKNGLPPDVSQIRLSAGLGKGPRRARRSSCSAPMLRGAGSIATTRESGKAWCSQRGTSPRKVRSAARARPRVAPARTAAVRASARRAARIEEAEERPKLLAPADELPTGDRHSRRIILRRRWPTSSSSPISARA
jgi:hypothetical protein